MIRDTNDPYTSDSRVDRPMNQENTAEDTTSARAETKLLTSMGSRGVPKGAAKFSTPIKNRKKMQNSST